MNWYKHANDLALARDIATWLMQAGQGNFEAATMHDDITMRMSGMDDPQSVDQALQGAVNMVSQQQGGMLHPAQIELITSIQQRISGVMPQAAPQQDTQLENT